MLQVKDIVKALDLEVVAGNGGLENEVNGMYIGDLLSWVMANIQKDNCWVTIQTNINIIAVAHLGEASCIIVAENATIDENTIEKADHENIPLLKSRLSAYQLAVSFQQLNKE